MGMSSSYAIARERGASEQIECREEVIISVPGIESQI